MINVAAARCVIEHFYDNFYASYFGVMDHHSRCLAAATQTGAQIGRAHRGDGDTSDLKLRLRLREACVRNQSCQDVDEFAHVVISGFRQRILELPRRSRSNQLLLKVKFRALSRQTIVIAKNPISCYSVTMLNSF